MKVSEYNLPRILTKEGHYYPIYSELGITYERYDKDGSWDDMKSLNEAYAWHFPIDYDGGDICYDYIIQQCTGIPTLNNSTNRLPFIYCGDIVRFEADGEEFEVKYNLHTLSFEFVDIRDENHILDNDFIINHSWFFSRYAEIEVEDWKVEFCKKMGISKNNN